MWISTGNKSAKFHVNILSLSENIAKSFKGATFLTHTVHVQHWVSVEFRPPAVLRLRPINFHAKGCGLFFHSDTDALTYRFSHYYFACAIGGQHDWHLPVWFPAINPLFISLSLHVLLAVGETNILSYY